MNNAKIIQSDQNIALGYLKAALIVLIVALHSVAAYIIVVPSIPSYSSLFTEPRNWIFYPIRDTQFSFGFTFYFLYIDVFVMALMFFLSGLFVWKSILRKGSRIFLRDRFLRLGLPFVILVLIASPLTYYPSYLVIEGFHSLSDFSSQWLSQKSWPASIYWFLSLLLAFNCIAVLIFKLIQKRKQSPAPTRSGIFNYPAVLAGLLFLFSACAYFPMALIYGHWSAWTCFGHFFTFQTSRLFFYAAYFIAGCIIGAVGIEQGLFTPDGRLAKRWPYWLGAAIVSYMVYFIIIILTSASSFLSYPQKMIMGFSFLLCCTASVFAFLALFIRFAQSHSRLYDSLQENAYGIYLFHIIFVTWLLYALLTVHISVIAKGFIVFICALLLSWGTTAALRRIPAVARVI